MITQRWVKGVLAATVLCGACTSRTATLQADPSNAQAMLLIARSGDTIRLAPGSYDTLSLKGRTFDKPVTIEATGATLRYVTFVSVSNILWRGGTFNGGDTEKYGFFVRTASDVSIEGTQMGHYMRTGILYDRITGGHISHNVFKDMGSDGIDVALSRKILIDSNQCSDFEPLPGAHPDCIQSWSRPTDPPVADLMIVRNKADGKMQGISLFNHFRAGADDGGFDRIVIAHNEVRLTYPPGISVQACRDCLVRDNKVEGIPGEQWKTIMRLEGTVTGCNNYVPLLPKSGGEPKCAASVPDPTPPLR